MLIKSSTEISDEIQLLRDQLPKIWDGCEWFLVVSCGI